MASRRRIRPVGFDVDVDVGCAAGAHIEPSPGAVTLLEFFLRARAYRDGAMTFLNVHATGAGLPTRTAYGDQRDACTNKAVVNQRVKKSAQPCPWLFHIARPGGTGECGEIQIVPLPFGISRA